MTEELKQKAHDYALDKYELIDIGQRDDMRAREEAYIAGAKENGIQWHDLRKGPNDLPVMETELLCQKYSGRCFVGYYNHADKKFYPYEKGNSYDVVDIVRWADIGIWWNIPTV